MTLASMRITIWSASNAAVSPLLVGRTDTFKVLTKHLNFMDRFWNSVQMNLSAHPYDSAFEALLLIDTLAPPITTTMTFKGNFPDGNGFRVT